ncbi:MULTISPECIES: thiamine diphosphokinase [Mammaliicoccus]|uniref:Thiamine diphosphokinase n=1 Tax=Mammaliicoccus vitulinus TaxID=71237 RepID=A0A2T4PRR4_9STAP|nr:MULTISPECIES: thiamine diphosphokinase [Mammaliicoccus]HAL08877.1 thiamine diphosphokinase [Staphylococcus sp.]PTI28853.1 thiamine diphosphokinase [Mammaliicoccus vitulinus]PTI36298.1 thiamine diphosphokinase [Mammaliicoccus vitulinus]PTI72471.1 thiamine diphosphokinase [Mammaliicoccus vitulinus]PTI90338.1 thiamine diphosphokinase [Mammaliicoccus vitulinus]
MKVNLLCSLRNVDKDVLQEQQNEWIGVDRGTLELLNHQIMPIAAVGDFDSVTNEELHQIKKQIEIDPVKKEKDDTDLALAVNLAVELGYAEIRIYGATGGRLDHFMGAVQILTKPEFLAEDIKISLIDSQNEITVLKPGSHRISQVEGMKYVSFIPLNTNIRIKLDEFKYELPYTTLEQGSTLTISNEFKEGYDQPLVTVELGNILMIQSKDK